jgi:hypothetical protein
VAVTAVFALGMVAPTFSHGAPAEAQTTTVSFNTAKAAPADAVTYFVATLDNTSTQWQLADELLDRAGVGAALDDAVSEGLKDEESGENLPLDAFMGGEVALVVSATALENAAEESMGGSNLDEMLGALGVATPEAAGPPEAQGVAVALDATAPDTAWAGIRESLKDQPTEQQDYQGTTILYAPPSGEDEEGMATAKVDDLILFSMVPADLYPLIDTIDGRNADITTIPEFTASRDALPDDFLAFGFVNNIPALQADLGPMAPMANTLSTKSFSAMTIAADQPGFRMETVTIPAAGETLPTMAEHYESNLVNVAPENALFFVSAADLGKTGVLDVLGATILGLAFGMSDASMMNPGATPVANNDPEAMIAKQFADAAALLGVNLQTEFFHQLVGEYGGWLTADMSTEHVSGLFASKTENPETVANALMQISFLIQGAAGSESLLSTREVAGGQVYVLNLGDEAGGSLEFGVVGDQFVLGSGEAIDRLESANGPSLVSNPRFEEVMSELPGEYNGIAYVDMTQAIPLLEAASEQADDFGGMMGSSGMTDASESCANYATQAEAQAAYDAGEPDTFDLDQDFDGVVCEDYFATSESTPMAASASDENGDAENPFANVDLSGIEAYGLVTYNDNDMQRSSAILYIAEK